MAERQERTVKAAETRERVVAETSLANGKYRVVRDEHGDYFTEFDDGEGSGREFQRSLGEALALFTELAREWEAASFYGGVEG